MASGVTAKSLPGNPPLLPTMEYGPEYLASSHFTISQDHEATRPCLKSVFKRDYPAWEILSKPKGAVPPKPADVLQTDFRYFNDKASETRIQYEYRYAPKPEIQADRDKLRATNFKMDKDLRFNTFQTTHNRDYVPVQSEVRSQAKLNTQQSCIPQGDREKADEPVSDYKDRYRGIDAAKYKPEIASNKHFGTLPTIQGDARQHHFNTTHKELYRGSMLPKLQAYPAPVGTNIPQGDKEKEHTWLSVQQQSFPEHDVSGRIYDRASALKIRETTFKQQENRLNNYVSTFKDSYVPKERTMERSMKGKTRNRSDIPTGDIRASNTGVTTNMFYQLEKGPAERPVIVSGADKRTQSNVFFGEPVAGERYYDTTHKDAFKPVSAPYNYQRNNDSHKHSIPTDYYTDNCNNTTYRDHFDDPLQDKMQINPLAIDRLKESHINAPLGADRYFSTEHKDQFIPKNIEMETYDKNRLQKSSVPIGTLNE